MGGLGYPFLSYWITVWEHGAVKTKWLLVLQERAIRGMAGLKETDPCQENCMGLNILTL